MKFEYFWWEDGAWKYKQIQLQPGDAVPGTPWTLFDIRPTGSTSGDNKALLVNNSGEVVSRFFKADMKDPAFIKLRDLVKGTTATAAGTGATGSLAP